MNVREAATADLDAVLAINLAGSSMANEARERYLADAVGNGDCLLGCEGIAPGGFAIWDRSFFGYPFVSLLIVRPDARRRGIATALVRQIEAVCDADRLFTSTNESNAPMRAVCAALGYEPSGRIDNLDDGDPELVFCRRLAQRSGGAQ